jgi:hypothetical protein
MPPGADLPKRDTPEVRYVTEQAVTDSGSAGAGLLYDARRSVQYAKRDTWTSAWRLRSG